jgi:hypothetical protein
VADFGDEEAAGGVGQEEAELSRIRHPSEGWVPGSEGAEPFTRRGPSLRWDDVI